MAGAQVKPFADSMGYRARFQGVVGTATAGQATNIDYQLTETRYINGVHLMLKDHVYGDTIDFKVVDMDNILGYGAGVVLDTFGTAWNVASDSEAQFPVVLSYPAQLVQGLYIRVVYHSTGESNVQVRANLHLHKPPPVT